MFTIWKIKTVKITVSLSRQACEIDLLEKQFKFIQPFSYFYVKLNLCCLLITPDELTCYCCSLMPYHHTPINQLILHASADRP